MPRIRQLPTKVITKIAAGEVIERPASVVKELLENSIDAGATRIDVELEDGGADRIQVVDNGHGIDPVDMSLAFASHATSKLHDADDLFRISTLGFRGEALASIGGVAQVTLQSRTPDAESGSELRCHGGELTEIRPWGGSPGTRIEVRHLFYNTPVRKKFLRATATELGHVCEALTRLALAHPTLHMTLRHNGRLVHEIPGSAALADRVGLFFGSEVRQKLLPIEAEAGPVCLNGYIIDPSCDRGHGRLQYLFVNGRWFRDRSLGHALQEAYRGLLMTGRYAVAFLFLRMPADALDVNVHPTKSEVRFRDSQALYHLIRSAVKRRLGEENLVPRLQVPNAVPLPPMPPPSMPPTTPVVTPWDMPPVSSRSPEPPRPFREPEVVPPPPAEPIPTKVVTTGLFATGSKPMKAMQIHDSYLVVETGDGVLMIDQHALHERILYEQFRRRFAEGQLERQRLLIPEPVELTAEQAARVMECREELNELGLEVEDFGNGTVLLGSYPTIFNRGSPVKLLKGAIDFLTNKDRPPTREQLLNDLMATMACKAAVKAGDRLNEEEISSLMAQRDLAENSHHCPHGRPTSLFFSHSELEKQFGRI